MEMEIIERHLDIVHRLVGEENKRDNSFVARVLRNWYESFNVLHGLDATPLTLKVEREYGQDYFILVWHDPLTGETTDTTKGDCCFQTVYEFEKTFKSINYYTSLAECINFVISNQYVLRVGDEQTVMAFIEADELVDEDDERNVRLVVDDETVKAIDHDKNDKRIYTAKVAENIKRLSRGTIVRVRFPRNGEFPVIVGLA